MPLVRRDGTYFGTLCALDTLPANLGHVDVTIFQLLADLIAFELEADDDEQRHHQELAAARREAELRERFIAVLGHDLRTPLTAIKGFVDAVTRDGRLDARDAARLAWISSSADRMALMVSELLDFARGRLGGGIPIDRVPGDAHAICRQVAREAEAEHPGRRVELRLDGDGTGAWDPARLAQVVANLLANALQYSPADTPVRLAARDEGDCVALAVQNQGPPIPADVLPTIFDPFRRGRADRYQGGLGLGLYIAQQIVQAHAGTIEVRSNERDGTVFQVRLPRRASAVPVASGRVRRGRRPGRARS